MLSSTVDCCFTATKPPVTAAALTTIEPPSLLQRGLFTVWLPAQLLYWTGGNTVIEPPSVTLGVQEFGLTVLILYVNVVSAPTTGAFPNIWTEFPSTETFAPLVKPKPLGEEENVTLLAPPPKVNCIGVIAVSWHTDWFIAAGSAPENTIVGNGFTVIVIDWVWSAHWLVFETAPETPVVIWNV